MDKLQKAAIDPRSGIYSDNATQRYVAKFYQKDKEEPEIIGSITYECANLEDENKSPAYLDWSRQVWIQLSKLGITVYPLPKITRNVRI